MQKKLTKVVNILTEGFCRETEQRKILHGCSKLVTKTKPSVILNAIVVSGKAEKTAEYSKKERKGEDITVN